MKSINVSLFEAADTGDAAGAQRAIANGAEVNVVSGYGLTPLHVVACNDQAEIARALIAAGASVDMTDDASDTPLHFAAMWGNMRVLRALIDANATINAVNEAGNTPLDLAGNDMTRRFLRQRGGVAGAQMHGMAPTPMMPSSGMRL